MPVVGVGESPVHSRPNTRLEVLLEVLDCAIFGRHRGCHSGQFKHGCRIRGGRPHTLEGRVRTRFLLHRGCDAGKLRSTGSLRPQNITRRFQALCGPRRTWCWVFVRVHKEHSEPKLCLDGVRGVARKSRHAPKLVF